MGFEIEVLLLGLQFSVIVIGIIDISDLLHEAVIWLPLDDVAGAILFVVGGYILLDYIVFEREGLFLHFLFEKMFKIFPIQVRDF